MILKNRSSIGRYFQYKINGIPFKVWIGAFQEYDLSSVDNRFKDAEKLNDWSLDANGSFGVNLDSHNYLLMKRIEEGKKFNTFVEGELVELSNENEDDSAVIGKAIIGKAIIK